SNAARMLAFAMTTSSTWVGRLSTSVSLLQSMQRPARYPASQPESPDRGAAPERVPARQRRATRRRSPTMGADTSGPRLTAAGALALVLALAPAPSHAAAGPGQRCASAKIEASAKAALCLL